MLDATKQPIDGLIYQLGVISNEDFDSETAKISKAQLCMHPMKAALFAELCEIKSRTVMLPRNFDDLSESKSNLLKLDKLLMAEEIIVPDYNVATSFDNSNSEYQSKLSQIRDTYQKKISQHEITKVSFAQQVGLLLQDQKTARPITDQEVQKFVDIIRQKFMEAQIRIKQCTCESVIEFKSKFFDARRKRRNFTKHQTDILNAYFNSHINNPYPDDATKELLARQCNITVSQVTNWFGNKRIRYKKSVPRVQQEETMQAAEQAMLNPYTAMFFPTPGSH